MSYDVSLHTAWACPHCGEALSSGDLVEVDIPWDTYEEKLGYRKYGPTHRRRS